MTGFFTGHHFNGFQVFTSKALLETKPTIHQQHLSRFVEYEESDWWWLLKYGFASYQPSLSVYLINGTDIWMHPDTWAKIKAEIDKAVKEHQELFERILQ